MVTPSPTARINNIANHLSPNTMASTTSFPADVVPQAPEDPLFGLMRAYRADESPDKVDLVRVAHDKRIFEPSRADWK